MYRNSGVRIHQLTCGVPRSPMWTRNEFSVPFNDLSGFLLGRANDERQEGKGWGGGRQSSVSQFCPFYFRQVECRSFLVFNLYTGLAWVGTGRVHVPGPSGLGGRCTRHISGPPVSEGKVWVTTGGYSRVRLKPEEHQEEPSVRVGV